MLAGGRRQGDDMMSDDDGEREEDLAGGQSSCACVCVGQAKVEQVMVRVLYALRVSTKAWPCQLQMASNFGEDL